MADQGPDNFLSWKQEVPGSRSLLQIEDETLLQLRGDVDDGTATESNPGYNVRL